MTWDAFLCHASEDKPFVEELVAKLRDHGIKVWFDKLEIRVGDSITAKINQGLAESRNGIVVLSPAFFAKTWTQAELSALFSRNVELNQVLLPVWHGIDYAGVSAKVPLLADRLAASSADGVDAVAKALADALVTAPPPTAASAELNDGTPITLASLTAFLPAEARNHAGDVYRNLRLLAVHLVGQYRESLDDKTAQGQLDEIYYRLLGRSPDPTGRCVYMPFLFFEGRRGYAVVEQSVLNSSEYAQNHPALADGAGGA